MATGRSVSRTIRNWVVVHKRPRVYKLPRWRFAPSAIPTFPHPSLYVGDFNCQHVNWGYNTTSPDSESLVSWATSNNLGILYNPKETASFFSHQWNVGTNRDLAFASFGQKSRLRKQTCSKRILAGTISAFSHKATKSQGSCPQRSGEALELSQGWLEARCLLTDESVERLPPPNTSNIERVYQDFCENLLSAAKQCMPRSRRKNHVPCWEKSSRPYISPSTWPQWGLNLIEPRRSYYLGSGGRRRSDGRKLLIPSTSRTLAARRGEPSRNLLARLDAPLAKANASQHVKNGGHQGSRDHEARQQAAVRPMENSNTWRSQYLWTL